MCLARQDCARPLRVRKERETFPQTTRGGSCCWGAAGSSLPGLGGAACGQVPLCIPPAASSLQVSRNQPPLHEMKAAGELLPRQCVLGLCATPAGSQQFPLALQELRTAQCGTSCHQPAVSRRGSRRGSRVELGDSQRTNPAHPLRLPCSSSGACAALSPQL